MHVLTQSSCHVVALTGGGTPDQLNFRSSSAWQRGWGRGEGEEGSSHYQMYANIQYLDLYWDQQVIFRTFAVSWSPGQGGQSTPLHLYGGMLVDHMTPPSLPSLLT